jgi:two-component system sensor histidine kinase TctE
MLRPSTEAGGTSPIALVQVAETQGKRSRLATEIIKGVILPQFVILLAVLLVWLALARGIAPLNELQQRIRRARATTSAPSTSWRRRGGGAAGALHQRPAGPAGPVGGAQKRFLADGPPAQDAAGRAAHAGRAGAARDRRRRRRPDRAPQPGADRLSSQRAAHMVNQLLSMARAEDEEQSRRQLPFDLADIATETVQDFVPKAMDKRIDLGYEGPARATPCPR